MTPAGAAEPATRRVGDRVAVAAVVAMLVVLVAGGCSARQPPAPATAGDGEPARVTRVIDGDTFDAELADGATERVRIAQVDTPERDECGYDEATAALEDLILGTTVALSTTARGPDTDPHGRLLRVVSAAGQDAGEHLIRAGAARWGRRYSGEDPDLATAYHDAERAASSASRGLWTACGWTS
ncbi:hypothetical protein G1H11_14685 [Phytoactinopolyspora alkaliphila]|uniref:TNase-like domain-containing protein n=1 Tax=Phytoactinopolyspora alkaliphila TaxID=1783498 RepID=A0A6N9YNJ9_9ACTN|nr:thermonuclease family protein [Phytoactinopolyspora alkaliphila]NED96554.1 hypothetical protein [Phytoactinopolyspora alkaliphila]